MLVAEIQFYRPSLVVFVSNTYAEHIVKDALGALSINWNDSTWQEPSAGVCGRERLLEKCQPSFALSTPSAGLVRRSKIGYGTQAICLIIKSLKASLAPLCSLGRMELRPAVV